MVLFACGIAGVLTLFVPLRTIVLSPLPFPEPDRLVTVSAPLLDSYTDAFPDRSSLGALFSGIAAYWRTEATLSGTTPASRITVTAVTPEFFRTIGWTTAGTMGFERYPIDARVAVVSEGLFLSQCGGARQWAGCTIALSRNQFDVVGVAPSGFSFPDNSQAWIPSRAPRGGDSSPATLIARLRPGVTLAAAQGRVRAIVSNRPIVQGLSRRADADLQSLHSHLVGERKGLLWVLWAVSIGFMFLACAGVANILLSDGLRRRHEMATRMAVGASRMRLVRQLLAETFALALAGATLGALGSAVAGRVLWAAIPTPLDNTVLALTWADLALAFFVALACALLSGLGPAVHTTGQAERTSIQSGKCGVGGFVRRRWFVSAAEGLAIAQLAVAMVLLSCAVLLLCTLTGKLAAPSGFEPNGVVVLEATIPTTSAMVAADGGFREQVRANPKLGGADLGGYTIRDTNAYRAAVGPAMRNLLARNAAWYADIVDAARAAPGVAAVGILLPAPFSMEASRVSEIRERPSPDAPSVRALVRLADGNAFRVLGIRVLAGRSFSAEEMAPPTMLRMLTDDARKIDDVAVVNERLAKRLWPAETAIGKRVYYMGSEHTVVGVVANIHERGDTPEVYATLYLPFPVVVPGTWTFVARVRPDAPLKAALDSVRRAVNEQIPELPPLRIRTLPDMIAEPLRTVRLAVILFALFAALSIVVASLGIYATSAESMALRTTEMGVRIALGATPTGIRLLAVRSSVVIALVSLPAGAFGAWGASVILRHAMPEVGALDAAATMACGVGLLLVAIAAALRPAFRIAAVDPVAALRAD